MTFPETLTVAGLYLIGTVWAFCIGFAVGYAWGWLWV